MTPFPPPSPTWRAGRPKVSRLFYWSPPRQEVSRDQLNRAEIYLLALTGPDLKYLSKHTQWNSSVKQPDSSRDDMCCRSRMELLFQRCHKEAFLLSVCRSVLLVACLVLVLSVSMYPGLRSIGVQLHSALTGSYVPGHHSLLLINSPTEQAAKDIGRAIMERRLAASVNILSRTSTMYYWKGEIQDASEVLMLLKTKTSRIQQVIDYVRSVHPYANPEVLSFPIEDGSLAYMKWMDEAVPDD